MAARWPSPGSDRVLILAARPGQFTGRHHESLLGFLDDSERRRMRRFRFEANRLEYLLAHALARWMLAGCLGEPDPARIPIVHGEYGKPRLACPEGPAFSLSHCAGAVACAMAYVGQLGVDVESAARRVSLDELGSLVNSPPELDRLAKERENGAAERTALRWWTIKEAFLKADGRGLGVGPAAVCCAEDGEKAAGRLALAPAVLTNPEAKHYQGAVVRGIDHHWIAWVVLGENPHLRPVYGEWQGSEDWIPMEAAERWRFKNDAGLSNRSA